MAAQLLAKIADFPDWTAMRTLGQLQREMPKSPSLAEMLAKTRDHLHEEPYALDELLQLFQVSEEQLVKVGLSDKTRHMKQFKLRWRSEHVYSEAAKVDRFQEVCDLAASGAYDGDPLKELGQIMFDGHESCRQLYECTCPELDELVHDCRSAGALGARMTGAGWGGCVVALVRKSDQHRFAEQLRDTFYAKSDERKQRFATAVFATEPASGAEVVELDSAAS